MDSIKSTLTFNDEIAVVYLLTICDDNVAFIE